MMPERALALRLENVILERAVSAVSLKGIDGCDGVVLCTTAALREHTRAELRARTVRQVTVQR
jgi:hypothetical protein